MATYEVRNKEDLDIALASVVRRDEINIRVGDINLDIPRTRAIVNVIDSTVTFPHGIWKAIATGGSVVHAYGDVFGVVFARDGATVFAHESVRIAAQKGSIAHAYDYSSITASNSVVHAYDKSFVTAYSAAEVFIKGKVVVSSFDNAIVHVGHKEAVVTALMQSVVNVPSSLISLGKDSQNRVTLHLEPSIELLDNATLKIVN